LIKRQADCFLGERTVIAPWFPLPNPEQLQASFGLTFDRAMA
jgi:hypothetical protein